MDLIMILSNLLNNAWLFLASVEFPGLGMSLAALMVSLFVVFLIIRFIFVFISGGQNHD